LAYTTVYLKEKVCVHDPKSKLMSSVSSLQQLLCVYTANTTMTLKSYG